MILGNNRVNTTLLRKQKGHAPPFGSAPALKNKGDYNSQNPHSFKAKHSYCQGSMIKRDSKAPACARCGRKHQGKCYDGKTFCFKCGKKGHFMRECPQILQSHGNKAQPSLVAPQDRVATQGAASGTRGETNRLYPIKSHQEKENLPNVFTGMIKLFDLLFMLC